MGDFVLDDVPTALWGTLFAAFRRVVDRTDRSALPAALRPFAQFQPAKLAGEHPRAALAEALRDDAWLREQIGEQLPGPLWQAAADQPADRLAATFGADAALAGLVARARWDAVADLGRQALAERERPAAPAEDSPRARTADEDRGRRAGQERRRTEAAERRARELEAELKGLRADLDRLRSENEGLRRRAEQEQGRQRDRIARLQRRLDEARARAQVDTERARDVAARLHDLADELQAALGAPEPAAAAPAPASVAAGEPASAAVPRRVPAAMPGRPCRLPAGVHGDAPAAVDALLQVAGLTVIVDGYNVSKDARGVPGTGLADQRAWLVQLATATAARCGVGLIVVFDGEDQRTKSAVARRNVRAVFTAEGETADDRIVAIVSDLAEAPVLVVSSDRDLRQRCEELGANVVGSGLFLRAVTAR